MNAEADPIRAQCADRAEDGPLVDGAADDDDVFVLLRRLDGGSIQRKEEGACSISGNTDSSSMT
jgi:hypothetical protein